MNNAEQVLSAALKAGASHAELYRMHAKSLMVQVSNLEIEAMSLNEDVGTGLRVIDGEHRLGYAYTTRFDDMEKLVEAAVANARTTQPDEHNVLVDETDGGHWHQDYVEQRFEDVDTERKIDKALAMERTARDTDSRIRGIRAATYADGEFRVEVYNSAGLSRGYGGAVCSASILVMAEQDGSAEMGWDFDHARTFDALDVEMVARNAARRATELLGAQPVESQAASVVLDRYVAAEILAIIVASMRADHVMKGKSMLADALDEQIAGPALSVVDCGDAPGAEIPRPIDGEGAKTGRTVVIDRGALRAYLHNAYTAHRMGEARGGHASRRSFRSVPEVGISNIYIEPGEKSRDELFEECSTGLYVTEMLGIHTADPISGDFSVGAAGRWIDGGELSRPVRGITVAGNIKDVLRRIEAVGNDSKFSGQIGAPSVLVRELAISGT